MPLTATRTTIGERLKVARQANGFSIRAAAEKAGGMSHVTLSSYERGLTTPTLDVLARLATLYDRDVNWFLQTGPALTGIRYRGLQSVSMRQRQMFEAESLKWLEAYCRIEAALQQQLEPRVSVNEADRSATPKQMADWVRQKLRLAEHHPVRSAVEVLEFFGVRVIELDTDARIDAMAARLGDTHVVVLNPRGSSDRGRMNALHELAHILYGHCDRTIETEQDEALAREVASHILLTNAMLKSAFEGRSVVRLVKFKEMYGISLAAMLYRAEHATPPLIPPSLAKRMWIEFSRRGWRTNEPGVVAPDQATRFEELVDGAVVRNKMDWRSAAECAAVREDELRQRVQLALGISAQKGGATDVIGRVGGEK